MRSPDVHLSSLSSSCGSIAILSSFRLEEMPTAVATAVESVTKSQSGVLVRNLFRLNVSEILHGRGCFEEQDFELREVNGSRVHSLGNPQIESSARAKAMIKWIEDGVFGSCPAHAPALARGDALACGP